MVRGRIVIQVGVEANNDHRFVIGAYMNYFRVSKFLTNIDTQSSYSPKYDEFHEIWGAVLMFQK